MIEKYKQIVQADKYILFFSYKLNKCDKFLRTNFMCFGISCFFLITRLKLGRYTRSSRIWDYPMSIKIAMLCALFLYLFISFSLVCLVLVYIFI